MTIHATNKNAITDFQSTTTDLTVMQLILYKYHRT